MHGVSWILLVSRGHLYHNSILGLVCFLNRNLIIYYSIFLNQCHSLSIVLLVKANIYIAYSAILYSWILTILAICGPKSWQNFTFNILTNIQVENLDQNVVNTFLSINISNTSNIKKFWVGIFKSQSPNNQVLLVRIFSHWQGSALLGWISSLFSGCWNMITKLGN